MNKNAAAETRRVRLKEWIDKYFNESQAEFAAKFDLNAGEVSGLLNQKSFGEKRARHLEKQAEMPDGYLDSVSPDGVINEGVSHFSLVKNSPDVIQIPQYDAVGSMGNGAYNDNVGIIRSLLVSKEWLSTNIPHCTSYANLGIVTGKGDSMKGVFNHGDPLIIDSGINSVEHDGIYYFEFEGEGFIKRLQRIPGDGIRVKSANSQDYDDWTIAKGASLNVFGRILKAWEGRNF